MSREAMKLALEALQKIYIAPEHEEYIRVWWPACEQAIAALRERLAQPEMEPCAGRNCGSTNPNLHSAECFEDHEKSTGMEQPEQEPVAWMHNVIEGNVITHIPADIGRHPERWTALYKDPTPCKTCESLAVAVMNDQTYHEKVIPKREWVGLTAQEIHEIDGYEEDRKMYRFARAIEAKLREKNT